MALLDKITPWLRFDTQAEEAANFYTSVFPNSRIVNITRFAGTGLEIHGNPEGTRSSCACACSAATCAGRCSCKKRVNCRRVDCVGSYFIDSKKGFSLMRLTVFDTPQHRLANACE
jgi:3-demethylubiquinone-9 3-methyltransferase